MVSTSIMRTRESHQKRGHNLPWLTSEILPSGAFLDNPTSPQMWGSSPSDRQILVRIKMMERRSSRSRSKVETTDLGSASSLNSPTVSYQKQPASDKIQPHPAPSFQALKAVDNRSRYLCFLRSIPLRVSCWTCGDAAAGHFKATCDPLSAKEEQFLVPLETTSSVTENDSSRNPRGELYPYL